MPFFSPDDFFPGPTSTTTERSSNDASSKLLMTSSQPADCQIFIIVGSILGCFLVAASLMMCLLSARLMKLTRKYKREKLEGVVREHRMKFGPHPAALFTSSPTSGAAGGGANLEQRTSNFLSAPQRWRQYLPCCGGRCWKFGRKSGILDSDDCSTTSTEDFIVINWQGRGSSSKNSSFNGGRGGEEKIDFGGDNFWYKGSQNTINANLLHKKGYKDQFTDVYYWESDMKLKLCYDFRALNVFCT